MILWLDTVDSTNAEARRRAEAGEDGPLWIAARRQTAGQGRRGRAWTTPQGGLAATRLATTTRSPADAAGASFVAALAAAELIDAYVPAALVGLKWPNDVLLAGAKVAGILVETGRRADGRLWLAVGVGVNLAMAPAGLGRTSAAIADHLRPDRDAAPTPGAALEALALGFDRWSRAWDAGGLAPVLEAWRARAVGIPGPCAVHLPRETLTGDATGLDSAGRLRLRLPDGTERRIAAGDVFLGGA